MTADPDIGNTVTRGPCATLWNETDAKYARTANHNYCNRFCVERESIFCVDCLASLKHSFCFSIHLYSLALPSRLNLMEWFHAITRYLWGVRIFLNWQYLANTVNSLRQHQPIDDRELDLLFYCYTQLFNPTAD